MEPYWYEPYSSCVFMKPPMNPAPLQLPQSICRLPRHSQQVPPVLKRPPKWSSLFTPSPSHWEHTTAPLPSQLLHRILLLKTSAAAGGPPPLLLSLGVSAVEFILTAILFACGPPLLCLAAVALNVAHSHCCVVTHAAWIRRVELPEFFFTVAAGAAVAINVSALLPSCVVAARPAIVEKNCARGFHLQARVLHSELRDSTEERRSIHFRGPHLLAWTKGIWLGPSSSDCFFFLGYFSGRFSTSVKNA